MTSQILFLTGLDSQSIVERLNKLKNDTALTELYISLIYIDQMVCDCIVDVLRSKERTWDGIHLAHCTGKVDVVITNALEQGSVRKITLLPDGHMIDDKCLYALANGLKNTKTAVETLVLRVNLCTDLAVALAEGLASNAALEDLSLMLSASDRRAIAALARGLQQNTNLKRLRLNRCSLEDGHVSDLIRALDSHTSLVELSVQGSCCRSKGMIAISSLLKSDSKKLVKLDLSNQQELATDTCAVSFLASALPTNRTLSFLDLSSNKLSEGDVTSLSAALTENTTLTELRLNNCSISDRSVMTIADHLPHMKGLRTLWLYGNRFDKAGARRLLDAVKHNAGLHQLLLPKDRSDAVNWIQKEMEYYLILNRGGRRLLTTSRGFPISAWPNVFNRAKHIKWNRVEQDSAEADVLFFMLQQAPSLLRHRMPLAK